MWFYYRAEGPSEASGGYWLLATGYWPLATDMGYR
jgi:hypothetical protein